MPSPSMIAMEEEAREPVTRTQWRFMIPRTDVTGNEFNMPWLDEKPTDYEITEWRNLFRIVHLESRQVVEHPPTRVATWVNE